MKAVVLFLVVLICTVQLARYTMAEESPAQAAQDDVFLEEAEAAEKRGAQTEEEAEEVF